MQTAYMAAAAAKMQETKKHESSATAVVVHAVSWLVFLLLPAVFNSRRQAGAWGYVADLLEPPRLANGLLLLAVFYSNYYVAIPRWYIPRRYVSFACSVLFWFSVFFVMNNMLTPAEVKAASGGGFEALGNSFNLFMFLIVYAVSMLLCLYEQWQSARERMLTAEISFLKAQINPHFLFNTLNSIYSLALTKSDSAPDAIIKLSGMMRYSVSETNQDYVSLSKELSYINNYIDLQKLRLTDNVHISYTQEGTELGRQIAPFILIPFIENAFKHGVNPEGNSDINIAIEISERTLVMTVVNNKVYVRTDMDSGTGLGIANTRQRLQRLYRGRHELSITDDEQKFAVYLKIELI